MADATPRRVEWALRPIPPPPRSIVELVMGRVLDAELAATLWLLVGGRVPFLVAADGAGAGRSTLLHALLDFLPAGAHPRELAGTSETFDWLPQAAEIGWQGAGSGLTPEALRDGSDVRPDRTVLLVPEFAADLPGQTWGEQARIAVRATSVGYQLTGTIRGDSLEDVLDALRRPPVGATDDELSRLGIVLILRHLADGRRRVVATHVIRPVARDEHGHVQRLGPAVLATWDAVDDSFEHFGWGVTPELALRIGWRAGDLELEIDERRAFLDGLARAGVTGVDDVRAAIAGYRSSIVSANPTS